MLVIKDIDMKQEAQEVIQHEKMEFIYSKRDKAEGLASASA
jgi:hypothetical protein